jgi:integrase/recombinase XerC
MSTERVPSTKKKSKLDLLTESISQLQETVNRNHDSLTIPDEAQQRTISEILVMVRREAMQTERSRRMAKVGKNDVMHERDTSTYRAYNTHWKQIEKALGHRNIHTITTNEITTIAKEAGLRAIAESKVRRAKKEARGIITTPSNGSRACNMCIDALRAIWKKAADAGAVKTDPMIAIKRERIRKSPRHGLSIYQMEDLFNYASTGGSDPVLDHTVLWTLSEAACRRGGIIHLTLGDINRERQTIRLFEKGDTVFYQPVTYALVERLLSLAAQRGSTKASDPVFRQLPTARSSTYRPIAGDVFDDLFARLKSKVSWSNEIDVSAHWVRHTTLTWVERSFGSAVAQKYARHQGGNVTAGYTESDVAEVAHALEVLTGTLHPLAQADPRFDVRNA